MANTDKNIVITPNIGSSNDPQIVFTGASATVGPQTITVRAYPTNNGTISFEGSSGQLFSVTNNLTGTVFSVNDVSGIPSIEVLDTGVVKLAQYGGNVLLGTGTDDGAKLHVEGGVSMTGGWNRTVTLRSNFPGIVFNSSNTRWASINYDHSSNFVIRVGATSSDTFGTGVSALSIGATSGTVTANGGTLLSQGNVNYNIWDTWLRENGDDAHVKLYGNSRQMVFRTDGTAEYASGVGGYAFAWMYGGDAASNRVMLINTSGDLWTSSNGWLSTALGNKLSTTGGTMTGAITFAGGQTWPTFNQNTTGTAANVTGTVALGNGGTGSTTASGAATNLGLGTTSNVQHGSLGVGTAASGTAGEIRATNNVTAYYTSDRRFKENVRDIPAPLSAVAAIGGKLFDWTDAYIASRGGEDGFFVRKADFGVIAQDAQAAFPLAVRTREDGTLAVDYEKLCALAFAAINELSARVAALEGR